MTLFRFNLDKEFASIGINAKSISRKAIRFMQKNINTALGEALKSVRAFTPHSGDGKPRGINTISNSLYNSWHVEYAASGSRLGFLELNNSRPYAKYVQFGHRMARHFVPWLYIGANGLINRETNHSGKLFGLNVGYNPATSWVPGTDMLTPAVQTFMDAVLRSVYASEKVQYDREKRKQISRHDMSLTELKGHYYDAKAEMSERRELAKVYSELDAKITSSMKEFLKSLFK